MYGDNKKPLKVVPIAPMIYGDKHKEEVAMLCIEHISDCVGHLLKYIADNCTLRASFYDRWASRKHLLLFILQVSCKNHWKKIREKLWGMLSILSLFSNKWLDA